ncbi:MAG TPA: hypothetical protein VHH36_01335, partial [Candidatus Thermoplasmatota archaeon]|nr:hypothetical protein [Candidatus Thermoplasmatota archaeon]
MRRVVEARRARGSLAADPKTDEGLSGPLPERALAWDEDATTLAIEAAEGLPRAPVAFVGPGIDAETLRVALDLPALPILAGDPMGAAKAARGPALAIGA